MPEQEGIFSEQPPPFATAFQASGKPLFHKYKIIFHYDIYERCKIYFTSIKINFDIGKKNLQIIRKRK